MQLYKTVVSDLSDLSDVYYDLLVFYSPLGIDSLFENFPDFKQNKTLIAVYGKNGWINNFLSVFNFSFYFPFLLFMMEGIR